MMEDIKKIAIGPENSPVLKQDKLLNTNNLDRSPRAAMDRLKRMILSLKIDGTYWNIPSYLGTHYISLYSVLLKWFNKKDSEFNPEILKQRLLEEQLPDGSWYAVKDANLPYGELNATIYNYFALKVMGVSTEEDFMQKARDFIISRGGIARAALFTKIWLALFGNYRWDKIQKVPLFLFKLNERSPISYHQFSQWVKPHLLPIAYIRKHKITKLLGDDFLLDELYAPKSSNELKKLREYRKNLIEKAISPDNGKYINEPLPGGGQFIHIAPNLKKVKTLLDIMLNTQQPNGSWGAYTISSLLTIISLQHLSEFFPKYASRIAEMIGSGFEFIEKMYFKSGSGAYRGVLDDGHFWDTSLISTALLENDPSLRDSLKPTLNYLLKNQTQSGGFCFGIDFWYAPDVDDSAEILITLSHMKAPIENIEKLKNWIISMQNDDGGWAAFDKNKDGNKLLRYFARKFKDSADLFDESCPDITGHVLEALSYAGLNKDNSESVRKAITYLKKTRKGKHGIWDARWGINYIYGTSAAIIGLLKAGVDVNDPLVQDPLRWLISKQNPDGGWGETSQSYDDPSLAGVGISTPSQTSWALLALMEGGYADSENVRKGIGYLTNYIGNHAEIADPSCVGTGHPHIIYMVYPSYPYAFTLMALSRYIKLTSGDGGH